MPVDRVILGCGNFGGIGSTLDLVGRGETEEQAFAIMDAAWQMGIHRFDTADAYGGGRSEATIGRWIAATGNRPRLTTKTFNPMEAGGDSGLARTRILRQIESSLGRLGVERVELYLAHAFDPATPVPDTAAVFEELLERGVVEAYGVSNVEANELALFLEAGRPTTVQNSYSLLERSDETAVLPLCAASGLAYQAFSPLAGGWLTGKYRRAEQPPAGSRMTLRPEPYRHLEDGRVYVGLELLADEAALRGVDTAALALAWLLASPHLDAIVVGPRRPEHLDPVMQALTVLLSEGERAALGSLFP